MALKGKYFLIFLSIVLLILLGAILGKRGVIHLYYLNEELKQLKASNLRIEKENCEFKKEIYRLKNDPCYMEEIAREELGLIREDEIIYQFRR